MRNGKGERRKEKGEMTNEKWRWEKGQRRKDKGEMEMGEGKRKRKDFPPGIPQQKVSLLLFRF